MTYVLDVVLKLLEVIVSIISLVLYLGGCLMLVLPVLAAIVILFG